MALEKKRSARGTQVRQEKVRHPAKRETRGIILLRHDQRKTLAIFWALIREGQEVKYERVRDYNEGHTLRFD